MSTIFRKDKGKYVNPKDEQITYIQNSVYNFLKENLKNESEISEWLVVNSVAASKSQIIIQKIKSQIKRHKKEDLFRTYLYLTLSIIGIFIFSYGIYESYKKHVKIQPVSGIVLISIIGMFFKELRNLYNLHFP